MENKQIVFTEKNCVEVHTSIIPEIGEYDVLIKTEITQISTGTELTHLSSNVSSDSLWINDIKFPSYPGYSNVGTIIKIGEKVPNDYLGKRVLSMGHHEKYTCVNFNSVVFIPDNIPSNEAVFGVIARIALASIRMAKIRPGDCVVVFGMGIIGQFIARLAKISGASKVIVTDVSQERLNLVPDEKAYIKADITKNSIIEIIKENNDNELADIVFEVTASPSLIEEELNCLNKFGKLIITSSPTGKSYVNFDLVNRRCISIIGAHNYISHSTVPTPRDPWTQERDSKYFIELLSKNLISVKELISHTERHELAPEIYQMLIKDRTKAMGVNFTWED